MRSAAARPSPASDLVDQNTARPLENLLSTAHCLSDCFGQFGQVAAPLGIFAAISDGADKIAAGSLRCPAHHLFELGLPDLDPPDLPVDILAGVDVVFSG